MDAYIVWIIIIMNKVESFYKKDPYILNKYAIITFTLHMYDFMRFEVKPEYTEYVAH